MRLLQRFQVRFVGQLFAGLVIPADLNNIHILKVRELSSNDADQLPALHTNLLPLYECHTAILPPFMETHNHSNV